MLFFSHILFSGISKSFFLSPPLAKYLILKDLSAARALIDSETESSLSIERKTLSTFFKFLIISALSMLGIK